MQYKRHFTKDQFYAKRTQIEEKTTTIVYAQEIMTNI